MQPLANENLDHVLEMMRHPRSVVTFSDSGAHVSQIMDSSLQTHVLAYWVRRRQALTLEEGVRMLTLEPASAWGLHDRGLLREGMAADIIVFDPDRVAPEMPEVVNDLPAGARRLRQKATGFRASIVNGQVVLRDGEHTGAFPGRLLRGPLGAPLVPSNTRSIRGAAPRHGGEDAGGASDRRWPSARGRPTPCASVR